MAGIITSLQQKILSTNFYVHSTNRFRNLRVADLNNRKAMTEYGRLRTVVHSIACRRHCPATNGRGRKFCKYF